ncbi:zinc finger transcription factor YY1-like [Musa acuminata AAA Group]|uniref:zinc finger transcription factor YY1-like n=1 Tax=Musa acuminata AAA Group TaxID=214697 RepID=UPI0031E12F6F
MEKRSIASARGRPTAVRWFKRWVPQDVVATGGKCHLLKWVTEGMLKALEDKSKDSVAEEQKPEPRTETLYLCTYEGCGKAFIEFGALKKHTHTHGEKQHVCQYEGCGKKFVDSSKLKRHYLIHTGERQFVCPHEGCGKAFSLDFNLKSHMKTHSLENYHVCPYPECGKKYTHESKLKSHLKAHHEKVTTVEMVKRKPASDKPHNTTKSAATAYVSASAERRFACPYEGCGKAYIHEYKLNLHLRKEHPGHNPVENRKSALSIDQTIDEPSNQDAYTTKGGIGKNSKRRKPNPTLLMPPAKLPKRTRQNLVLLDTKTVKNHMQTKEMYEEDSQETEEDRGNIIKTDGWSHHDMNDEDEDAEMEAV